MIILGAICLILGFILAIKILWYIGAVLLVVGLLLWLFGSIGNRPVGGRSHWY
jgi:hypothetical protein